MLLPISKCFSIVPHRGCKRVLKLRNQHGNGNGHIVFVSAWPSFFVCLTSQIYSFCLYKNLVCQFFSPNTVECCCGVLIFFCEGFFILSSYTNVGVCERKKASSFAILIQRGAFARIANVLAFLWWLDINHAYFVFSDLSVCTKLSR